MSAPFWGKYRGVVSNNLDPLQQGRIQATVPDVLGSQPSGWAMPSAPFGGNQAGFFAVPPTGAGVWMEFEHGDPDYPIWSGCWWGAATERPPILIAGPPGVQKVLIQTTSGHNILLDDTPGIGGITLQTATGAKIVINAMGIEINNGMGGTIKLTGPQVSVNNGALDVI